MARPKTPKKRTVVAWGVVVGSNVLYIVRTAKVARYLARQQNFKFIELGQPYRAAVVKLTGSYTEGRK
jgi:hypothetical protein